jgi:predicted ester cyclase
MASASHVQCVRSVDFTALQLFRVEDELIVEHWEIFDETTLTHQLSG